MLDITLHKYKKSKGKHPKVLYLYQKRKRPSEQQFKLMLKLLKGNESSLLDKHLTLIKHTTYFVRKVV